MNIMNILRQISDWYFGGLGWVLFTILGVVLGWPIGHSLAWWNLHLDKDFYNRQAADRCRREFWVLLTIAILLCGVFPALMVWARHAR